MGRSVASSAQSVVDFVTLGAAVHRFDRIFALTQSQVGSDRKWLKLYDFGGHGRRHAGGSGGAECQE